MRPHYSHSSRENATPYNSTSRLASYKEVLHSSPAPQDEYDKKCSVSDPVLSFEEDANKRSPSF